MVSEVSRRSLDRITPAGQNHGTEKPAGDRERSPILTAIGLAPRNDPAVCDMTAISPALDGSRRLPADSRHVLRRAGVMTPHQIWALADIYLQDSTIHVATKQYAISRLHKWLILYLDHSAAFWALFRLPCYACFPFTPHPMNVTRPACIY